MKYLKKYTLQRWVRAPEWLWGFVVTTALALTAYLVNMIMTEPSPGSAWGITYGTMAAVLIIGVALYGVRRRNLRIKVGRSHTWVQFHVYGGMLFLLFVFMHSGFRIPSGQVTWWLWFCAIWITVSGWIGIALQKWIPRVLTSGLAIEVVYERIPELAAQIKEKAEQLIMTCTDPVREFYSKNIAAVLATPQTRLIYYFDITGGAQSQLRQFEYLRRVLSAEEQERLDHLEAMYKSKLELDAHYTLQKALRWWLYGHVPVSLILIGLLLVHLYSVFYY